MFSESPSRIVISFAANDLDRVKSVAGDCPFEVIGTIGGNDLSVAVDGVATITVPVRELELVWFRSLEGHLYPAEETKN